MSHEREEELRALEIGEVVVWRTRDGCRFGRLLELGTKWARVQFGSAGKRRVLIEECSPWPPDYEGQVPVCMVKRGVS